MIGAQLFGGPHDGTTVKVAARTAVVTMPEEDHFEYEPSAEFAVPVQVVHYRYDWRGSRTRFGLLLFEYAGRF